MTNTEVKKNTKVDKTKIIKTVTIALMAAIMCVMAPFSIPVPVSAVPISLGTFALYLISAVTDRKSGTLAVILYLLLGLVGVPVFTGWTGGFAKLAGPTGGYLIGYIPCAYISGLFADKFEKHKWMLPIGYVLGTVVMYAFGTVFFMIQSGNSLAYSLSVCVVPFLGFDALKIAVSTIVTVPVRSALKKFYNT